MFKHHFSSAITALDPDEGELLRIVYLRKKNGVMLAFVGALIDETEFEQVDGMVMGEVIEIRGRDDVYTG
jgi:hypothetical protein